MQSLHVGQIGTPIKLKIHDTFLLDDLDLTGATVQMLFQKPDGTQVTVAGSIVSPATDGEVQYTPSAASFLDLAGQWSVQGFVTIGSTVIPTSFRSFTVAANLGVPA